LKRSDEQINVIQAAPSQKTLVNSGPGTGKTDVACARVAWLVDEYGVNPNNIVVISFTRAAVAEFRNRLFTYAKENSAIDSVRITTLDSFASKLRAGFEKSASAVKSYDNAIALAIKEIDQNKELRDYLQGIEHLVIDEAQDVVGVRAILLAEVIAELSQEAGVSVFSDDAQAIYGFATDDSENYEGPSETLPELIREHLEFVELELTQIYRTSDKKLIELFTRGRNIALADLPGLENYDSMREVVSAAAHSAIDSPAYDKTYEKFETKNTFMLFRRRGEALEASSFMNDEPRRLRLQGQPTYLKPWLAKMFWDWKDTTMVKSVFVKRSVERGLELADEHWAALERIAGSDHDQISVTRLRLALQKPDISNSIIVDSEAGQDGPIFATIHSAKGREAEEVRLFLSMPYVDDSPVASHVEDEAKVLFVGATRARKVLKVGVLAFRSFAGTLPSGRARTKLPYNRTFRSSVQRIEVGRKDDIDSTGLVGYEKFASLDDAVFAQNLLGLMSQAVVGVELLKLKQEKESGVVEWPYVLVAADGDGTKPICFMSKHFQQDLHFACDFNATPSRIRYIKSLGSHTVVLAPDSDQIDKLHSPWRESGFMLAPTISSYPQVFYKKSPR